MEGYPYTWELGRGTEWWVEERLDRVLASSSWMEMFPAAKVLNLDATTSDHSALLLKLREVGMPRLSRKFKFENVWLKEGQCRVMRRIWVNSSQRPLIEKLQRYAIDIQRWGGGFLPVCRGRMKIFQACLAKLKGRRDVASALQFETIRKELDSAIDQYEQYWKQCVKNFGLQGGDSNTRFFHSEASIRRKANNITQ
ncbi:hypothetical protein P3X46_033209 [Hevea brasiliensis]|uniref:Uncharacterized protein n=2 Tax=Hevea brasiliensis TaxID=3981 RepID=A0ABQ9KIL2_HEVBR|nr:hypothetical protein P3X46_033209 [Hevea brasiliensis]